VAVPIAVVPFTRSRSGAVEPAELARGRVPTDVAVSVSDDALGEEDSLLPARCEGSPASAGCEDSPPPADADAAPAADATAAPCAEPLVEAAEPSMEPAAASELTAALAAGADRDASAPALGCASPSAGLVVPGVSPAVFGVSPPAAAALAGLLVWPAPDPVPDTSLAGAGLLACSPAGGTDSLA